MRMLLLLSLTGSIALASGILLQKVTERFSFSRLQGLWLKVTLALYLISGFAAAGIKYMIRKLYITECPDGERDIFISHKRAGVLQYDTGVTVNRIFILYVIVTFAAVAVMAFLFLKKMSEYRTIKRAVTESAFYQRAGIPEGELEELKNRIGLKKEVQIYLTDVPIGAFTIGYFHPVIVLGDEPVKEKREVILLHELCHIKRKDILFKFAGMAAVCVHWFNPFIYCLPGLINRNTELECDEMAVSYLSMEQRKIYAQEIIDQARQVREDGNILMRLGGNVSLTKERVINIMKNERKTKSKVSACLTAVLTVVMVMVSSVPVWAYEAVPVFKISGEEEFVRREAETFSDSDIVFTTGEGFFYEPNKNIRYDEQFVDEEGNIYEVDIEKSGRAVCKHSSLSSGTYQKHIKNSTGGCVVESYSAKRCNECGETFMGNLISKTNFPTCIH